MTRSRKQSADHYYKRGERIAALAEEGRSQKEISSIVGISVKAVCTTLYRRKMALAGSGVVAVNGRIPESERAEFQAMTERAKPLIKALRGES